MTPIVTQFAAEEASGVAALGFDPKAFVIQLITFLLAYLILRRYAFGPILRVLRERREKIESSVKLSEKLEREQAELEAKVEKTLNETRAQADDIIAGAQDTARQAIREAEDKAREKADQVLAEAQSRIETETARARQKLEADLVGLISDATEAIIEDKVDARKDASLIERALRESRP